METLPISSEEPRCQACGRQEINKDGRCICGHLKWPGKPFEIVNAPTDPEKPKTETKE